MKVWQLSRKMLKWDCPGHEIEKGGCCQQLVWKQLKCQSGMQVIGMCLVWDFSLLCSSINVVKEGIYRNRRGGCRQNVSFNFTTLLWQVAFCHIFTFRFHIYTLIQTCFCFIQENQVSQPKLYPQVFFFLHRVNAG